MPQIQSAGRILLQPIFLEKTGFIGVDFFKYLRIAFWKNLF